jgi:hypothetical protein
MRNAAAKRFIAKVSRVANICAATRSISASIICDAAVGFAHDAEQLVFASLLSANYAGPHSLFAHGLNRLRFQYLNKPASTGYALPSL